MIKFQRDKDGNLYAVKDGEIIGQVQAYGDNQPNKTEEDPQHGNSSRKRKI